MVNPELTSDKSLGKWFAKYPDTEINVENELITWKRKSKKIVTKINNSETEEFVSEILKKAVFNEKIINLKAVKALVENNIIFTADSKHEMDSKLIHFKSSAPLNGATDISDDMLEKMEFNSINKRFPKGTPLGEKFNTPYPLMRRRSLKVGGNAPPTLTGLSEKEITSLLNSLYDTSNRSYPSAGALYPINFIVEQKKDDGSVLYIYDTYKNCITKGPSNNIPYKAYGIDPYLDAAETKIWFVADLKNVTYKYGIRGYRYSLIEAGHSAQYLIQLLNWYGYECRPFGGYHDLIVADNLGLKNEVVLYSLAVFSDDKNKQKKDWISAEESRSLIINNESINYFVAVGGKDSIGDQIQGYGIDMDYDLARIKSHAELVERIALTSCEEPIKNSNGMAAHTIFQEASTNAKFELYERHCVLRTWLLREKRNSIKIPNTKIGRISNALALKGKVKIKILDITDPFYKIPCVMPIIYSEEHGGILTSSSANCLEIKAIDKALLEIVKSLLFRLLVKKTEIFPQIDMIKNIDHPEDHEEWYARSNIEKDITDFLTKNPNIRSYDPKYYDSSELDKVITIQDLTRYSPDSSFWKVVRASSDNLMLLDFGTMSNEYWERAEQVLSKKKDDLNQLLHPIG